MPLQTTTTFGQRFAEQLEHIRAKIETLPASQQTYFRRLADEAHQQQQSMEGDCARVRQLVADMQLQEASVRFDCWAATETLRRRGEIGH